MRNMLLIAKREYLEQIRGRAFRLSTILVPVVIIGMLGVMAYTGNKMGSGSHIAIASDSPWLANDVKSNLLEDKKAGYKIEVFAPFTEQERANLMSQVKNKTFDALLTIENSSSADPKVTLASESSLELEGTSDLRTAVNYGLVNLRLAQKGMTPDQVKAVVKGIKINTVQVYATGKTGKSEGMGPFYAAFIVTFLMTMPILLYGLDMARSIVEEKTSRIFEVMLSVTRADDMLAGKLVGVGAVGLTQIAIWVAAAVAFSGSSLFAVLMSGDMKIQFTWMEGAFFPVYFVLGFFLYSAFFSGLAATCETAQDLQMYISLAVVPTWAAFFIMPFLLKNPGAPWVVAASIFPPTAPLVMPARMGLVAVPIWQTALSVLLLAACIWAVLWFASRLYRIGILMYGKRATLPELLQWLRYS
ncbi:MAG TPA: ABC transporter permease [Terracidiphilus sp.]|nr:ABC transporter permease [Terracidiphilus sp.]